MTIVFNSGTGRLVTWESRDRKFGQLPICLPLSIIHYQYSGPGDADEHDHSSPVCRQGSVLVSLAKQCSCYCRSVFLHLGFSCRSPWRSGGTVDRTVRIWNTASMTQLQSFDTGSQVLLSSCSKSVEKLHCSACRFPRSPGTASTRRWSRGTDFRITSLQFGVILGEHKSFILQIDHPIPSNGSTMKCFQVDNLIFSMGKVADLTGHTSRLNYTCWQCLE